MIKWNGLQSLTIESLNRAMQDLVKQFNDFTGGTTASGGTQVVSTSSTVAEHDHDDRYYTKQDTDDKLDLKADKTNTYTKIEVNNLLDDGWQLQRQIIPDGTTITIPLGYELSVSGLSIEGILNVDGELIQI